MPTLDGTKLNGVIDLKGQVWSLSKTLYPSGSCTLRNGTIQFNGGLLSSLFHVGSGATLDASDIFAQMTTKQRFCDIDQGGTFAATRIHQNNGGIGKSAGAKSVQLIDCSLDGTPDEYFYANFSDMLHRFVWKNPGIKTPIKGGLKQAIVRLQQCDDFLIEDVETEGKVKQDFAIRPGGRPGTRYGGGIFRRVKAKSSDNGNFKDPTDKDFPFGRTHLIQYEACIIGAITTTQGGPTGIGSAWGVDTMNVIKCVVGGKLVTYTVH